jgi:hypothetical protein
MSYSATAGSIGVRLRATGIVMAERSDRERQQNLAPQPRRGAPPAIFQQIAGKRLAAMSHLLKKGERDASRQRMLHARSP